MLPENEKFIVNPYIAGSPVKDASMFFGREDVYAWLRQHLQGAYQDNIIVLYGERRSGKTSILYQMKNGLGDDRYIPVLLDLQGMGLEGIDGFLWETARKIVLTLRSVDDIPPLDRPKRRNFEASPRQHFEDYFLPPVIEALGQHRLLLMFDETNRLAEKIQDGQLPFDVFDYLRALVQQVDQINFLFSLGRRIEVTERGSSQLFNLAVYRKISFLDEDYAEDLITRPVATYYSYTPMAVDRILELTCGQPYYTQLLCHNLFSRWLQNRPEQLDVADAEAVVPDVLEQGTPNFQFVWQDSTPVEQAILAALAHAAPRNRGGVMRRSLDKTLRRAKMFPPDGDVTGGLQQLFERDMLNDQEPYELKLGLVQLWLAKFKRLDWVREELAEVVAHWQKLEEQRRAEAPTSVEQAKRWAAPVLAVLLLILVVLTSILFQNLREVRQASSAALDAAEALRVTQAARLNATLAAASTEVARLRSLNNPEGLAARATAQAKEAIAAIELAQITATAVQAQAEAEQEAASATTAPTETATPVPTPTATSTATSAPPTSTPLPTPTPRPALATSLRGTIAYPGFNGATYNIYFGDVTNGTSRLYRTEASQPAFSPDGEQIAFQSWRGNSRGLITASSSGGNEYLIANFLEDELPVWNPDGSNILFFSRRAGDRQARLYLIRPNIDFRNNQAQLLTFGDYPSWGNSGEVVFRGSGNTGSGLRLAPADFARIRTVTSSDQDFAPALSPDGQKIAFMARSEGNWDIYVIGVDGSNRTRLTTDPARDGLPTWSPDGRAIAFTSNRDGAWAVWAMAATGSEQQKLLEMSGSPDGIVIYEQANSSGWLEERISWKSP